MKVKLSKPYFDGMRLHPSDEIVEIPGSPEDVEKLGEIVASSKVSAKGGKKEKVVKNADQS